jgi:hypothetical protein
MNKNYCTECERFTFGFIDKSINIKSFKRCEYCKTELVNYEVHLRTEHNKETFSIGENLIRAYGCVTYKINDTGYIDIVPHEPYVPILEDEVDLEKLYLGVDTSVEEAVSDILKEEEDYVDVVRNPGSPLKTIFERLRDNLTINNEED